MFLVISITGKALMKQCEGCRLTPYKDSGGTWTIGWGHALAAKDKVQGLDKTSQGNWTGSIELVAANQLFEDDCWTTETQLNNVLKVGLRDYQFDALGMLAFNVGVQALVNGGLIQQINATGGNTESLREIAPVFLDYCHCQGLILRGLQIRAILTAARWLNNCYQG
jgi:lysozyme